MFKINNIVISEEMIVVGKGCTWLGPGILNRSPIVSVLFQGGDGLVASWLDQ